MENDYVSLADAATRLGVTVRQAQRLASSLSPPDKEIREHGAVWVRWTAMSLRTSYRKGSPDTRRDTNDQILELITKVATLTSELETARAEIVRLMSEIDELKVEKGRHLDIMLTQASAMAQLDSRPLMLAESASAPSHVPFWRAWWRRK